MNGFADHGLDESAFGESKAISAVKAFDAFREYTSVSRCRHISSMGGRLETRNIEESHIIEMSGLTTHPSQNQTLLPTTHLHRRRLDPLPNHPLHPPQHNRAPALVGGHNLPHLLRRKRHFSRPANQSGHRRRNAMFRPPHQRSRRCRR